LSGKDWHAGVIGITASKVVECFNRPAVIIAVDDKVGRGSARSIGNVNIYRVLNECKDFFINFGGHKQAAGFSIAPENVEPFKVAFQKKANEFIDIQDLRPIMSVDMKLSPLEMTLELAESLDVLQPFGQGNPMPIFYTDELRVIDCRTVGDGSHVKATFVDETGKIVIDGIGFGLSGKMSFFQKRDIAVAFHLTVNEWKNVKRPQLQIVDVK
jgi:single-stranded-DNA-specific exonuclease